MKKTKLLTSLAALALVVSLGACEVNVDVGGVDVGDVDVGVDVNPNDSSEPDEGGTTDTDTNPGTGEGGDENPSDTDSTPIEPPVTYTYSLEVENGDSLTLTYDEALETQQGVDLSIKLVTTSSTGDETKEDASADNLTFTVSDPTVVKVTGLTVLPLSGGETSITIKWSEHDEATASVGVTVTDVTVYGPTSWADYITNEYDLGVIAGAFGDVSLDEILPFSYELLTNSSYSFQSYYVSAESFRLMYSWPSDSNGLTSAWDTLLTDFGYTQVSSETSGVYTTVTYTLEGGYKIEIKYSSVGDWDLYLYPPEPEPADPASWADYITNEYDLGVIAGAFGDVSLDEILPFSYELLTNSSYSFQSYYVSAESFRLMYSWPSDSTGLYNAWDALLTGFGYTLVSTEGSGPVTYTYTLEGGYTVKIITSTWGDWDLYLYPPEPEPEPASTWNEYITNDYDRGQIANLFGSVEALDEILPFYIGDTDPTSITTGSSVNGTRLIITYNTEPTGLLNNWIGLLVADGWTQTGHESSYNEIYTFEKDGYKVELVSEFGSFYLYLYPKAEEPEPASAWDEYITNENYRAAVSEIFGSVEALDEFLPFYGDTDPVSITAGSHYQKGARLVIEYSSDILATWVSLLTNDGWEQTAYEASWETTYTFEKDGYTVDLELMYGTLYVYVYPKAEAGDEDLETAQAILNAVQGSTPNWTAFYAAVTKDDDDAYTEYLTTDGDGNLYGYRYDWDDWEEEGSEFWYYGGYKCMYSYDGSQAQTPGEVYTTFEDELEALTYSLTISFNLASDPYTLTEVDGGYELTVAKSTTYYNTYTFTVDASYNLLAIDTDAQIGSQSDEIALGHVEGITYADVEAFIATTNFNPADFGFGEGGDEQGEPGEGGKAGDLTLSDYISALSDKGFNYGDGFYFCQQSLDMSSGLDYDSLEIEALSNDVGYASQGHYDATSGYYASEFYSDGTTTYVYDTDDQEAADAGGLCGYWFYQYTLESYFDLDTIVEQLNSLGEDADLTDSDNVITDDYLYLYAYSADYSAMVELFATYDENGITYLVYSYGTNTSSYAVEFYPTESVTTPEWYVPDTGATEENPLAAVAGTYTGTTAGSNSMRLLLNEDGTGIYDYEGTSPRNITWTLEGTTVTFELDGDDVVLTWDADAGTLIGTYYQDYGEYEIAVNLTKDETDLGDTQEEVINLVGTWTGQGTYSNTYTVTIYADGTYKLVLPGAEYTGTWTGSLDGTIELDVSSTVLEYFKLTYNAANDTALVDFEDDDYNDYTNVVYTRAG